MKENFPRKHYKCKNHLKIAKINFLLGSLFQLRGFPPAINSKVLLVDIFTRLIWTASAQHTAVNYPIAAYGAFTPNMPTKIYDDDRVAPEVFNAYRLPNGFVSAVSKESKF